MIIIIIDKASKTELFDLSLSVMFKVCLFAGSINHWGDMSGSGAINTNVRENHYDDFIFLVGKNVTTC